MSYLSPSLVRNSDEIDADEEEIDIEGISEFGSGNTMFHSVDRQ